MYVIGLTGLIGTGKSEIARLCARIGIPVHDADACVHKLYTQKHVQDAVVNIIPQARGFWTRRLSREKLARALKDNPERREKLEALIHPLVRDDQIAFMRKNKDARHVVLDVPLLFETRADLLCDEIWVTHCRPELQRKRVLRRPGFTQEKLDMVLSWQGDGRDKMARADRLIDTGASRARLLRQIKSWLK